MDLNDLNSTASPIIRANVNEAMNNSAAQTASRYSSGSGEARGLLNDSGATNSSLAYGDKATSDAIRSRYTQDFNRNERALKTQIMKNADADHIKNLQLASNAAGQEVEMNKQKEILRWKIRQQEKRARGQVLGSVLGIAGGIGGIATMGGPGGAMAGYAIGSGTGNAIGGDL